MTISLFSWSRTSCASLPVSSTPCASLTWAWQSATRVATPVTPAVWSWYLELPSCGFAWKARRQSTNIYVISHHTLFTFWGTSCANPKKAGTTVGSQWFFGYVWIQISGVQSFHPSPDGISLESKQQEVATVWSKERRRRFWTPVARLLLRLLLRGLQQGGYWADLLRTLLSQPLGRGLGRGGWMHRALLQLCWLCLLCFLKGMRFWKSGFYPAVVGGYLLPTCTFSRS